MVREELEAHIEARVAAHLLSGMSEDAAVEATLSELGTSKQVGTDMARVYAPRVVLGAAIRAAWRQLQTRIVESLLIVVAVALGVGVIIAVASFLDVEGQVANMLSVPLPAREMSIRASELGGAFDGNDGVRVVRLGDSGYRRPIFRHSDLQELRLAVPAADYVYLRVSSRAWNYAEGSRQDQVNVVAVTEDFLSAAKVTLVEGSLITESDIAQERLVVVMTREALGVLQITGDPIGKQVAFGNVQPDHTIIGVIESDDLGDRVSGLAPYRGASSGTLYDLYLAVEDPRDFQPAREQLASYTATRWGDSVTSRLQPYSYLLSPAKRLTALALAGFASVGLLVASLNVMNLMLARVLRRGSLIGVRRSLGATRSDIRKELIVEGMLLGVLGGLIGVLVGSGLLSAYNQSLDPASAARELVIGVSLPSIGVGLLLALGASLLFTLYPAGVASRQAIVAALKES